VIILSLPPEFPEKRAATDVIHPSMVIVAGAFAAAKIFAGDPV